MSGTVESAAPDRVRQRRESAGRYAEAVAAFLLVCKGYRILAWRHRSRLGEIDLIARRGRRLAFVEVKARPTLDRAMAALGETQTRRIWAAAEHWVARHPRHQGCEMGFDAVLVIGGRMPRHLPNALQPLY